MSTCDSCAGRAFRLQGRTEQRAEPDAAKAQPSSAPSGTIQSGTRLGDFEIEKRIGSGGMGIVYQARQVSLNRSAEGRTGDAVERTQRSG